MEILNQSVIGEAVTISDVLGLEMVTCDEDMATWNQPRSTEQLLGFIARREAAISDLNEV